MKTFFLIIFTCFLKTVLKNNYIKRRMIKNNTWEAGICPEKASNP